MTILAKFVIGGLVIWAVAFADQAGSVLNAFDSFILEEPPCDPKRWTIVQPSAIPGWWEKSSASTAWDTASL